MELNMQNLVSSCVTHKVTGFVSSPPSNTIQWVSFSNVKASNIKSFGASTQSANSQQILGISASGGVEYFHVQGPFAVADFGNLKKSSIHVSQVPAAVAKAIAAVGSSGHANMLNMTVPPKAKAAPKSFFVGSIPLGLSLETLFIPMCGGQANWLSIGIYGIIALVLIWWFWLRRA